MRHPALAFSLLALLLGGCPLLPAATPEAERVAPAPATDTTPSQAAERLQRILDAAVTAQDIPGAVVALVGGPGERTLASGWADLTAERVMVTGDRLRIGSITKTYVAAVVLQLWAEGELDLEDTVADWLPELADEFPQAGPITLHQLLNHTSGLADYATDDFYAAVEERDSEEPWTADEALVYAYDLEPLDEPGAAHHYSNTNYLLLERVIEAVTEDSLAVAVRSRLLEPLGLDDTFLEHREPLPKELAEGYQDLDGDGELDGTRDYDDGLGLGDGGLVATALDVARWGRALLTPDAVLDAATLEVLQTDLVDDGEGAEYGLGVMRWDTEWGEAWGHTGSMQGFQSTLWYLPQFDLAIAVLINAGDDGDAEAIAEAFVELLLSGEAAIAPLL